MVCLSVAKGENPRRRHGPSSRYERASVAARPSTAPSAFDRDQLPPGLCSCRFEGDLRLCESASTTRAPTLPPRSRNGAGACFGGGAGSGPLPSRMRSEGWAWSRVSGLGSRVSGLGSRASGLGSRLSGLGSRVSGLGSRVSGLGSRLSGLGSRVSGLGSRVSGLGSRVSGLGSRVSGLGSRVSSLRDACPEGMWTTRAGGRCGP